MDFQKWVDTVRKQWAIVSALAVSIITIIGAAVLPPPSSGNEIFDTSLTRIVQIVIGLLLAVSFGLAVSFRDPGDSLFWGALLILTGGLALVLAFTYLQLTERFTVEYDGAAVVVGSKYSYTDYAAEYRERNPGISDSELVMDFGGQLSAVWNEDSIAERRLILAGLYVFSLPLLAFAIVAAAQIISCVARPSHRRAEDASSTSDSTQQSDGLAMVTIH